MSDTSAPPYSSRAPGSSFGPFDFWNPATEAIVPGAVAAVDLSAPTRDLTTAAYTGPGSSDAAYQPNRSGIALATAIIAGGATLVTDAGKDLFGGGRAIDARVVKSVLQNSASKLPDWNNGQTLSAGVLTTTQSLDYQYGAGRMDLARAYPQYTAGTTDLPGVGAGAVQPVGWDFARVSADASADYHIMGRLRGGTTLTATLNWFLENAYDYATDTLSDQSYDNLDLQVWKVTAAGENPQLIAESVSLYNNAEHLSFLLPETGHYMLRVRWTGEVFDKIGDADEELFAISWSAMPALAGDVNFNGRIDISDYFAIDRGRAMGLIGYINGDFNLSGGPPNADDYIAMDRSFLNQMSAVPAGAPPHAVPEPAAALPLLAAIWLSLTRRGRRLLDDQRE